jgi:hypothetical protein
MDLFTDDNDVVWRVHKAAVCAGSHCAIHNPSDHPLKNARRVLRGPDPFSLKPVGFVERVCEHGSGHSDPDSVAFYDNNGHPGTGVHGCDECCRGEMNVAFDAEDWKPEDEGVGTDPVDFSRLNDREIDAEVSKFAIQLGNYPTCEEEN